MVRGRQGGIERVEVERGGDEGGQFISLNVACRKRDKDWQWTDVRFRNGVSRVQGEGKRGGHLPPSGALISYLHE